MSRDATDDHPPLTPSEVAPPQRAHRSTRERAALDARRRALLGPDGAPQPRPRRKARAHLRLTDAEWAAARARVRETGRTTGRYLRELVLGTVPRASRTQANAALVREMARVGNNLNQLAHAAHASGRLPEAARLDAVLHDLLEVVQRIG